MTYISATGQNTSFRILETKGHVETLKKGEKWVKAQTGDNIDIDTKIKLKDKISVIEIVDKNGFVYPCKTIGEHTVSQIIKYNKDLIQAMAEKPNNYISLGTTVRGCLYCPDIQWSQISASDSIEVITENHSDNVKFYFKVENTGDSLLYFNIAIIDNDNNITPCFDSCIPLNHKKNINLSELLFIKQSGREYSFALLASCERFDNKIFEKKIKDKDINNDKRYILILKEITPI